MYTPNHSFFFRVMGLINWSLYNSEVKYYKFEKGDDDLGSGNSFIKHVEIIQKHVGKW